MNDWTDWDGVGWTGWFGKDGLTGFQLDYDRKRGMIRVSYLEDGRLKDEGFFDVEILKEQI